MIKASIITIGDELLIGQTIDTNSAWMAMELNKIGIRIFRRVAVGDVWEEIWNALDAESKSVEVVLITGGLGPTSDDITKPLLCAYFNGKMTTDALALENVKHIFEKLLNRPMLERNLRQADVPDSCKVIQNKRGTAPGMIFEKNGAIFISMPGVPHEMKGMMELDVLPLLQKTYSLAPVIHRTLLTSGIGESYLAELLIEFENELPNEIKMAYLPSYGMVKVRLTTMGGEKNEEIVHEQFEKLKKIVLPYLVTDEDKSIPEVLAQLFWERKQTLAVAESCTGGYISHLITMIPGSSSFFMGGVVSYANEMKMDALSVPSETITSFGAVSLQTVEKMAEGVRKLGKTDFGLATSGIMGPGGATDQKPVGFVCVAVSSEAGTFSRTFQFRFDRHRNIELSALNALEFLRKNMG